MYVCIYILFCFLEHSISPFIQIFDFFQQFLAYRSCTCFLRFTPIFFFFLAIVIATIFLFWVSICSLLVCRNNWFLYFYLVSSDLAELNSSRSFLGRLLGIFFASYHVCFSFFLLFQGSFFFVYFLLRELPLDTLAAHSLCFPSSQSVLISSSFLKDIFVFSARISEKYFCSTFLETLLYVYFQKQFYCLFSVLLKITLSQKCTAFWKFGVLQSSVVKLGNLVIIQSTKQMG